MIFIIEFGTQIIGHYLVEIIVDDAFSDVAATPLVTEHKTKRHNALRDFFAIVNAGIRAGSQDTGDSRISAKESMTSGKRIGINLYIIDFEYNSKKHRHLYLIRLATTTRTVKENLSNILIIYCFTCFVNNSTNSFIISEIRVKTIGNEAFNNIITIKKHPFGFR